MTRRQLIKRTLALGAVGGSGCLGYGATTGRHALTVERVPVTLPVSQPFTIATFGDLHFDPLFNYLYVNRGVGTIGPHVRFFCRPEITLIEATPA